MTSTLDTIVARTRVTVAKAKETTTLETLKARIREVAPPRNFFRAVVDPPGSRGPLSVRVIAEVKRRSPSAGEIREDFDPVAIARGYAEAGASAISCLTDEPHFGGHLGYIQQIRSAVQLPVLRKDFIIDPYQIYEARAAGADAILLISEIVSEGAILDYLILAKDLGMTTLVEVHDVENLLRVKRHIGFPHRGYSLLGINNRDLTTMTTDINHTFRLLDMLDEEGIDRNIIVSESGIRTHDDLAALQKRGVHVALVGEHLLREEDPGRALEQMLHGPRAAS